MWIINETGYAINTDYVVKFYQDDFDVIATVVGQPLPTTEIAVGETTIDAIISNIISGTPVMEVR